jgi:hypothetical protein
VDDGRLLAEVVLPVDNVDWEEVALGPCPDLSGPCVFVADTGDNDDDRNSIAVHAFPEPVIDIAVATKAPARVALDALWTMPMQFHDGGHDGGHDVEAIAVLPDATAIVFFEKTKNDAARIWAYRAPWTPLSPSDGVVDNDAPRVLEETGTVMLPSSLFGVSDAVEQRITGASLHWSGRRLVLRTTVGIVEFDAADPSAFLDLSSTTPHRVWSSPPGEEQGEAVAWDEAGTSLFTISEAKKADDAPVLHRASCAP